MKGWGKRAAWTVAYIISGLILYSTWTEETGRWLGIVAGVGAIVYLAVVHIGEKIDRLQRSINNMRP